MTPVAERRLNRGHVRIQSSGVAPRRIVIPGARGLKPTPIHQISLREEGIGTLGRRFCDLPCLRFAAEQHLMVARPFKVCHYPHFFHAHPTPTRFYNKAWGRRDNGAPQENWTEIFMHPVPRGRPILETAEEVTSEINRSREYLAECLRTIGRV